MVWLYCIAGVCLLIIILYLFAVAPARRGRMKKYYGVKFAHRGLHGNGVPENSLTAFEAAVSAGYGIELDVWLTKDGHLVVSHDADTKRMCGESRIIPDSTLEELSSLRLGGTDEKIPEFKDVLSLIGGKVPLLVELKSVFSETDVCEPTAKLLDGYENYVVESFNPFALSWFKKNRPAVLRGQLSSNFKKDDPAHKGVSYFALRFMLTNFISRPHFIAYNEKYKGNISAVLCRKLFGAPLFLWTVKGKDAPSGCDGIIFEL